MVFVQVPSEETLTHYIDKYVQPRLGKDDFMDRESWNLYQQSLGWLEACEYFFGVSHKVAFIQAQDYLEDPTHG